MKSNKIDEAMRHVVLLHALRDAGPEAHKAIFDANSDEDTLHGHLSRYAQRMHEDMRNSAAGKNDGDTDDKGSTAQKVGKMFDEMSSAVPAPEKSTADRDSARQKKVGQLFKK